MRIPSQTRNSAGITDKLSLVIASYPICKIQNVVKAVDNIMLIPITYYVANQVREPYVIGIKMILHRDCIIFVDFKN